MGRKDEEKKKWCEIGEMQDVVHTGQTMNVIDMYVIIKYPFNIIID